MEESVAQWSCPECMMDNPRNVPACEACFSPKPQISGLRSTTMVDGGVIPFYTVEGDMLPPPPAQLPPDLRLTSVSEPVPPPKRLSDDNSQDHKIDPASFVPAPVSFAPVPAPDDAKSVAHTYEDNQAGRDRQVSLDEVGRSSVSEAAAPPEKPLAKRYCFQCRALTTKNSILMYRNWRSSLCILITPALFVLLIGLVAISENTTATGNRQPADIMCLGPNCDSEPIIAKCAIFDSREGKYGFGGLIPDAKCTTIVFAPSDNPEVVSIMTELATKNKLSAPVIGKTSETPYTDVVAGGDVVGMATASDLHRWFSNVANIGWAMSAVVFDTSASYVNTLPPNIHYEIWYNKSITLNSFGQSWMGTAGFDSFSLATSKSSVSLKVQRAVNEAIINVRGRVNNTNFNMPLDITMRPFPDYPFVNPADPPVRIANFGSLLYFLAMIGIFLFSMVEIVGEKERNLVLMMRTIGLYESVFWLSWCLYFAVLILLSVLLLLIVGYSFGMAVPFFGSTDFRCLFVLFFMYGISLSAFGFFWASLLGSINKAIWAGLLWTLAGLLTQIVFLPFFGPFLVQLIHDPYALPRWGLYLAQFYPPIGFGLAIEEIQTSTAPRLVLNTVTGNVDTIYTKFTWSDFVGDPGTLIVGTNLTSFVCDDAVCNPFTKVPPVDFVNFQLVVFFFWMLLAWYVSSANATGSVFFIFTPSFWLPSSKYKPKAKDAANPKKSEDADVQAETDACVNGKNKEGGVCVINLHKKYGSHMAVNGLCVSMERNKVFCLLGHNGAGKTTSLNMICGITPITKGEAYVGGFSVHAELDRVRQQIGVCPQHDVLWPQLTALEHLRFASLFKGQSPRESAAIVDEALESVKLTSVKNKQAGQYSGGMKRRLSVAMSAMGNPSVIFMDEPTTGMDPMNRKHVWDAIQRLKKGRVVVLTTHSMEEADAVGDRIGIMSAGRLEAIGTALHLKNKHGLGYLVRLVTSQGPRVEAIVKGIMPQAVLTDNSAGSLTYSVPPSALPHMPTLFAWIEDTLQQEHGLLVDWAVSNTTLEEVFINLARELKPHSPKKEANKPSKQEAKAASAEAVVPVDEKSQIESAKYNSDGTEPAGYSALFRQRGALQRRQLKTNVCLGCCPATAMLLLLLASWALDLIPANYFETQAIQAAADKAVCLNCRAAAYPICMGCALPGADPQQCVSNAFVLPPPTQAGNYQNPSQQRAEDFALFGICATCTMCQNPANADNYIFINQSSVICNSTQTQQTCQYAQAMCTCNGTAYTDAVAYSCSSESYEGYWKGFTSTPQDSCQKYEEALNTALMLNPPFPIAGFHERVAFVASDMSSYGYFNNDGDSTGQFIGVVAGTGVSPSLVGSKEGGKLATLYRNALSPQNGGAKDYNDYNDYPPIQDVIVHDQPLYSSLLLQQSSLNKSGIAGLMKQDVIVTSANVQGPSMNCPLKFIFDNVSYDDCWSATNAAFSAYGLFSDCYNQSEYESLNLSGFDFPEPGFVLPPFANASRPDTCHSVTGDFVSFYNLGADPCRVFQESSLYVYASLPPPENGGFQSIQCQNPSCSLRRGSRCLVDSCEGTVSTTCRAVNSTDCVLTTGERQQSHFYASPAFKQYASEHELNELVWELQSDTEARKLPHFQTSQRLEASEAINNRYPAGAIIFHSLSPTRVSATLQGFYTPVGARSSQYGLVNVQINRTAVPTNASDDYGPSCDGSNTPVYNPCPQCGGGGYPGEPLSQQQRERLQQQILAGIFPSFTRLHLGDSAMSEISAANVLLDYLSDGVLKAFVDESHSISTSLRPHPYLNENAAAVLAIADTGKSVLSELFVGLASSILLAPLMLPIVVEKEKKLRAMMKMMGLNMRVYWFVTYIWSMFFCLCVLIYMLIVAAITGLYPGGNVLSRTAGGLVLMIMVLWAHSQTMLAFLISSFFSRARCVSIFGFLFLIMLVILSLVLNQAVFSDPSWGGAPSPWYLMLLSPMAYYRCLNLLSHRAYTWDSLGGSELGRNMGFMFLDSLIYMLLAWYLEQVLPQEFGVQRKPCFCFADPFNVCCRKVRGVKDVELDLLRNHSPQDDSERAVEEDIDVQNERARVLRKDIPDDSPVQIVNLRKVYPGGFVAVENVTLHIENGECFGLLGPNGAGKTTTISMLTGLFAMSGGDAKLCGFDLQTQLSSIYRIMGVCPQFDICWPDLSVRDHLLFYCRVKGVKKAIQHDMVRDIIKDVGLAHAADKMAKALSGGMQRRLSLAIALVGNPRIVFLDEPTTGLDPETKRNIWALIDSLKAGRCIILTTHSMEEADALCGRIGIMSHGLMRCLGTGIHLKNKYGNGYKIDIRCQVGYKKRAQAFVSRLLPTAVVESAFGETVTFQVAKQDVKLSKVFQALLARPADIGIVDYGVRQTSLEEVFLKIARESEDAFAAGK